jgi:hypothetical protein
MLTTHRLLMPLMAVAVAVLLCGARALAQGFPTLRPLNSSGLVTYFIDEGERGSGYQAGDRQLAEWALKAWEKSVGGALRFAASAEKDAIVRVYWVPAGDGRYGEMRSFELRGRPAAAVFIRPDAGALDPEIDRAASRDPLMRDTVVYLTCLHELGHALGLSHTSSFADIMFYFGYGGDIPNYFGRYRLRLTTREDIAKSSGLSIQDVERISARYPRAH